MATRMQQRRGTAAQWISTNSGNGPILNAGEIGYETDTNKFKIGDGTNHWVNLDYFIDSNSAANPSFGSSITFEGATANDFETTVAVAEPTADRTITFPDATGIVVLSDINGNITIPGSLTVTGATTTIDSTVINVQNELKFEGTTANNFETSLVGGDPTADRTITLPDLTGTVVLDQGAQTLYTKSINLNSNILTGTAAEFNAALSDADFATLAGTQTLTNKTLTSPNVNEAVALLATATELNVLDGITSSTAELNILDGVTSTAAELNILDGVTSSTAELNILDGVTATTAELNKLAGVTATSAEINILTGLTSTAAELNILDGATLSVTELNYVDGVTSAIQTQLNNKQAVVTDVSDTEIGYLNGVTSAIQTQLDAKAALSSPTFTGTVVLPSGTVTSAMILDGTIVNADISATAAIDWTKISASSTISETELGYLDGVTSAIQTQLNGKQATVANVSDVEIGYLDGVTSSIQTQLGNKQAVVANVSDTEIGYLDGVTSAIQTQLDAKLASATASSTYAPLASPALTGTPTATLAVTGTNTTQIATTSFVQQELSVLTTGAPGALNTLDELAAALGDDANYAATITTALGNKAPLASPTFTGTVTLPAAGIVFTDGTQALEGVPSRTPIIQKTASYTLSLLTERDDLIEMGSASAITLTIPTDATLDFPVGTSIDILQTGAGQVTIAPVSGTVTVNSTPGLKLRTQWSTATLFKRAANTWVVYGDLTA
jgi:hypothetical protein